MRSAGLGLGALEVMSNTMLSAAAPPPQSFLSQPPRMKLGTVTYNLAKDWDIDTIIKHCTEARFDGVELRTTHAHKVEVDLTKAQREEVRKRFQITVHRSTTELLS